MGIPEAVRKDHLAVLVCQRNPGELVRPPICEHQAVHVGSLGSSGSMAPVFWFRFFRFTTERAFLLVWGIGLGNLRVTWRFLGIALDGLGVCVTTRKCKKHRSCHHVKRGDTGIERFHHFVPLRQWFSDQYVGKTQFPAMAIIARLVSLRQSGSNPKFGGLSAAMRFRSGMASFASDPIFPKAIMDSRRTDVGVLTDAV